MESLNPNLPDKDNESGSTDSAESTKKKKKKSTRAPLPFVTASEVKAKKEQKKDKKNPEEKRQNNEQDVVAQRSSDASLDTLVERTVIEYKLGTVSETEPSRAEDTSEDITYPEESEYLGELIIDHSDKKSETILPSVVDETKLNRVAPDIQIENEQVYRNIPEEDLNNTTEIISASEPIFEYSPRSGIMTEASVLIPFEATADTVEQDSKDDQVRQITHEQVLAKSGIDASNMINPSEYNRDREYYSTAQPTNEIEASQKSYEAPKRSEKHISGHNVTTWPIFGWWFGRRGRSRAERAIQQSIVDNNEAIKQATFDINREKELSNRRISLLERTQYELNRALSKTKREIENVRSNISEQAYQPKYHEFDSQTPESAAPVFEINDRPYESEAKLKPDSTEIALESRTTDNIIETSAWHRVELDKRTGHLAENPSVEYGQEFAREQSQEKLAREAAAAQTAAQLGTTLFAGGVPTSSSQSDFTTNSENVSSKPTTDISQEIVYMGRQIVNNTKNPSIWLVAFVIVLFLFAVGLL